jgi:hypothetical protein
MAISVAACSLGKSHVPDAAVEVVTSHWQPLADREMSNPTGAFYERELVVQPDGKTAPERLQAVADAFRQAGWTLQGTNGKGGATTTKYDGVDATWLTSAGQRAACVGHEQECFPPAPAGWVVVDFVP